MGEYIHDKRYKASRLKVGPLNLRLNAEIFLSNRRIGIHTFSLMNIYSLKNEYSDIVDRFTHLYGCVNTQLIECVSTHLEDYMRLLSMHPPMIPPSSRRDHMFGGVLACRRA